MRSIAVFQTYTAAERARRTLAAAAIYGETVKVDPTRTRRGCSWGVSFAGLQRGNALSVLSSAGINTREIIDL